MCVIVFKERELEIMVDMLREYHSLYGNIYADRCGVKPVCVTPSR
jgi:hypothetical protein